MEIILETAAKLGQQIASSAEAENLKALQAQFEADAALVEDFKNFQTQAEKMQQLEQSGSTIEVADKQNLTQLREKLLASNLFMKLNEAQMKYSDMMRQVNQTIGENIA